MEIVADDQMHLSNGQAGEVQDLVHYQALTVVNVPSSGSTNCTDCISKASLKLFRGGRLSVHSGLHNPFNLILGGYF